jgi:heptosyltransferase III
MTTNQAQRFLIVRHDNLGDVALALPMAGLLKRNYPKCTVHFVVRKYALDLVTASAFVDGAIVLESVEQFKRDLKQLQPDVIIFPFPSRELAKAAYEVGVSIRIGTSRRWFHWIWCNKRPRVRRKDSPLHEAQLNLQLLKPLVSDWNVPLERVWALAGLYATTGAGEAPEWPLKPGVCNILVQMLSNGHAREWPMERFVSLIQGLAASSYNVIINGTPKEGERLRQKAPGLFKLPQVTDATEKFPVSALLKTLHHVDLVISNSTGPLHMGALSGAKTLGLFVDRPAMSASRWGPLGPHCKVLQAPKEVCTGCEPGAAQCACMLAITVEQMHAEVRACMTRAE